MNNIVQLNQTVKKNLHVTAQSLHFFMKSSQLDDFIVRNCLASNNQVNYQILLQSNC